MPTTRIALGLLTVAWTATESRFGKLGLQWCDGTGIADIDRGGALRPTWHSGGGGESTKHWRAATITPSTLVD